VKSQISIFPVLMWLACLSMPGTAFAAADFKDKTVVICDDQNEWPPYIYFERNGNGTRTGKVTGYSIAVIDAIFARHGIKRELRMVPWARCLADLQEGSRAHLAMNMTQSVERSRILLFTRPYYSMHSHYFYSARSFPKGLQIGSLADLRKYRTCGLKGYNYERIPVQNMDQGSKDYQSLVSKLHLARCDVFLEQYEAMVGFGAIGQRHLDDPALRHDRLPELEPSAFVMGVSRKYPHAAALQVLLDSELQRMERSGELKAIWNRFSAK
jgi:polar amino acid transport system substrate-binding protein